ncbi:MAG: Serine/threonine kinase [Myxococcales bacterium]|nr:Serine/threonine kinase [Myxococcales bacterium]
MQCLTDGEWAAFTAGKMDAATATAAARHLSGCDPCRVRFGWTQPTAETRGGKPAAARPLLHDDGLDHGTQLGRYLILEQLGAGGMGVVYVAFDPQLDRKVAVKVLRTNLGVDQSRFRARMLREAKAMARLSHPNIVAVHDVGVEGDRVFLAMELVEGGTLKSWLRGKKPTWRQVLELYRGAGRGLAAAHAAGLVHRDFKPENVLVGADERARVTDFGLARSLASRETPSEETEASLDEDEAPPAVSADAMDSLDAALTRAGTVMGTPGYMAPEQVYGEVADARSDQFGFCAALYEALYGQRAFPGSSADEVNQAVADGKVREPAPDSKVPAWLRRALLRGLRVDPDERWPSMDALIEVLSDDPAQRRLRWIAAGAALLTAFAIVAATRHFGDARERMCQGAERRLGGVWDPARKAAVARAFARSGKGWAARAGQETTRALDGYAAGWVAEHGDACEATRLRGEQSEAVMELRMGCLDERRRELGALTELFVAADDETVERAVQAVEALPPVSMCSDVRGLTQAEPQPSDPRLRAVIAEQRNRLATARARLSAGKYKEGVEASAPVQPVAAQLGYRPLVAEERMLAGELEFKTGDYHGAERAWKDALYASEEARLDELKSRVAVRLANVTVDLHGFAEAHEWLRFAEATVRRAGASGEVQVALWIQIAQVYYRESRYPEAETAARKAIALSADALPPSHMGRAAAYHMLGDVLKYEGKYDEAMQLLEKARAIAESSLGPEHPEVAYILRKEVDVYSMRHDGARALELGQRVLALLQRSLPPESLTIAQTHTNLAEALGLLGRYDEALAEEERALPTYTRVFGPESENVGVSNTNIGFALLQLGRTAEARQRLTRAIAIYQKTLAPDAPDLAEPILRLGELELRERRPREAVRQLERALQLRERDRDPTEMLADIELALAQALAASRDGHARAEALAKRARDQWAAAGQPLRAQAASALLTQLAR